MDDVKKRKFLTLPGLELRPLRRPARSQSLYRLRYPGSSVRPVLFLPVAPTSEHRADFSVSFIILTDGRTPWAGDQLVAND